MKVSQEKIVFLFRLFLYVVYLLVGAAIFQVVEEENFLLELKKLKNVRRLVLNKYNISEFGQEEEIVFYSYYLLTYAASHGEWSFGNSVLFCLTTITTIGYGNLVPRTTGGRLFCILYSLIGIPSTCVVLKSFGDQIAGLISIVITKLEMKCFRRKYPWRVKLKTTSATVILTLFGVLPLFAVIVKVRRTELTFVQCFYFIFVSLSTIGFGDIIPHFEREPDYLLLFFLFVGLSFVSSIFCSLNLFIEKHGLGSQFNKALTSRKARWSDGKRRYQVSTRSIPSATDSSLKQTDWGVDAATQTDVDTFRIING